MILTDEKLVELIETTLNSLRFEPISPSVKMMVDDTIAVEIPLNFARKYAELIIAHNKI